MAVTLFFFFRWFLSRLHRVAPSVAPFVRLTVFFTPVARHFVVPAGVLAGLVDRGVHRIEA